MDVEIKEWKTQSVKHKIATVLIMDGVPFHYNEEDGIIFSASEAYVTRLARRIVNVYGASLEPIINEIK